MKKTILNFILAFIGFSNLINAQAPNYLWAKSVGGVNYERNIAVDSNGNTYVTGHYGSGTITFGSFTLTNSGLFDIYVVKYDTNGDVVWAKSAGGTGYDYGVGIAVDASGNCFVTGNFESGYLTFGSSTLTNPNPNLYGDMFILKYDSLGNALWAKSAAGTFREYGIDIDVDANGNSYVTGYFMGPSVTFGSTTLTNADQTFYTDEMFIVKYDASGNVVWAKSGRGNSFDEGRGIVVDAAGNSYVTGWFANPGVLFGSVYLADTSGYTVFVVKYDTDGGVVWAKKAGGTGIDYGQDIALDSVGNILVTGDSAGDPWTFGTSTLTNAAPAYSDMFILKFDSSGNPVWGKRVGGDYGDKGTGIAVDSSGNSYVTGYWGSTSISFGSTTFSGNTLGNYRMFIVKYNASGGVVWAKSPGTALTGVEREMSIGTDSNGYCYAAGSFDSNTLTLGSTVLSNPNGDSNTFLAKLDNVPAGATPVAAFTANVINIPIGGSVNFTDLSTNSPTEWSWTFTGASTTNSSVQNPVNIIYNSEGCYTVSLTATNNGGSSTTTQICYINVGNVSVSCNQLFFSEYLEGSASNKALEIYNPSNNAINLSSYSVELYANGSSTATQTQVLSGTLASHDVYVIANSSSIAEILALADSTSSVCNFNGDDAIVLKNGSNTIDVIGQVGIDPGVSWTVGTGSTLDNTLVRNPSVDGPSTSWTTVQNQWVANAVNSIVNLGQHNSNCSTLATAAFDENANYVAVAPNPTTGQLKISTKNEVSKITIMDLNGRIVNEKAFDNSEVVEVNIANLLNGVYLMRIETKAGTFTKKILKK